VKLTVNFDDPGSYHLYYGDDRGSPGTILTFFAWPGAHRGRIGPPQVSATALAVPAEALDYWADRLKQRGVALEPADPRAAERVLSFDDPDGMRLELVAAPTAATRGAPRLTAVPPDYAIRGLHGVTIAEEGHEVTARLLTDVMGFRAEAGPAGGEHSAGNRFRYRATGGDGFASVVDLLCVPDARRGTLGAGVVHHVAFRTPDDEQQAVWRRLIAGRGHNVSPVMDRTYFHSIYFREPGGVLFEIATDSPGFTADQPAEELGTKLALPPWLEPHRANLASALPPLRLPRRANG
jgi:glyoxalase family protein